MVLQKPHAPIPAAFACVLHDLRLQGRFISLLDTTKTIRNALAPGDYLAEEKNLINAFKGSGDELDLKLQLVLNEDAAVLGSSDDVVLAVRRGRCSDVRMSEVGSR